MVSISLAVLATALLYNSNWFHSVFFPNDFYKDVYSVEYDTTKVGESVSIPLKYNFNTCYALEMAVHDKKLFYSRASLNGMLRYRFMSKGLVVAEGLTQRPNNRYMIFYRGMTSIIIMTFDLPFVDNGDELTLNLEVVEPMAFLEPFSGNIVCRVKPSYDAKLGKCHGEALRIVY
jgi:hypothetical protein